MTNHGARTLEERIQDLEAEWQIRNLVATYLLKADTRDVAGYVDTFAEDGVLDIAGLHFDKVGMDVPPNTHRKRGDRQRLQPVHRTDAVLYVAPRAHTLYRSNWEQRHRTLGLDSRGQHSGVWADAIRRCLPR